MELSAAVEILRNTAAIFGAVATIAGIPALQAYLAKGRQYYASDRKDALDGTWEGGGGDTYLENGNERLHFTIELRFKVKGRRLEATGRLFPSDGELQKHAGAVDLVANGGFYDSNLVQLMYRSKDPHRRQMGVIVLRLSDDGKNMNGNYAGHSPTRGYFVSGQVQLDKKANV